MEKKRIKNFLKEEINKLDFNNYKNNKIYILMNIFYIILALTIILSSSINFNIFDFSNNIAHGIIAQLQIIILFYLSLNFAKTGIFSALILSVFSLFSQAAIIIFKNRVLYVPGLIAYTTVLIVIFFIYNYQQEINTKVKELEKEKEKLEHMAYYDNLTGIANRAMIIKRLDFLASKAKNEKINYKLTFIDFKNFKKINDFWGYKTGDYILKEIAKRLKNAADNNDLIGRLGGDEFAVVVEKELNKKELKRYLRKIKRKIEKPYKYKNKEITLDTFIGVSSFPGDGKNSSEIIKSTDIALHKAKNSSKDIVYFVKNMEKDVIVDVKMEDSLQRAIKKEEFHLLFQPQYKINGKEIRGFEALIRWNSSEIGTVSPDRFIPIAEKTGLIKEIGIWILKTALKKFKSFKNRIEIEPILSINISVVQLIDPQFVDQVKKIIEQEGISDLKLEFEITESFFISDQEYIVDVLYKLKDLGINIAMDDFGTGYASLSYLQHIPLDILKIDKVFIDVISQKKKNEKMMIPPMIEMAHEWGIKVVAEGVENTKQLHYLEDHNCDYVQGFLFNKPLSEKQIREIF